MMTKEEFIRYCGTEEEVPIIDDAGMKDYTLQELSDKILQHLENFPEDGKRIVIIGDWDADGGIPCGVAVLREKSTQEITKKYKEYQQYIKLHNKYGHL